MTVAYSAGISMGFSLRMGVRKKIPRYACGEGYFCPNFNSNYYTVNAFSTGNEWGIENVFMHA